MLDLETIILCFTRIFVSNNRSRSSCSYRRLVSGSTFNLSCHGFTANPGESPYHLSGTYNHRRVVVNLYLPSVRFLAAGGHVDANKLYPSPTPHTHTHLVHKTVTVSFFFQYVLTPVLDQSGLEQGVWPSSLISWSSCNLRNKCWQLLWLSEARC